MTSAVERTRASLARIAAHDGALRSCLLVRGEAALAEAAEVDARDEPGAPAGWTLAVKDNTDVAGTVTTDGLGPPHPAPAAADATAVRRLRAAGAVVVAKANLEQLSFGATTQNPDFGACRNPWDTTRIPGGSSGGSAVAVAAGLVDAALGTDTGGSLRNPAAFCGVCALRPTHGLVPVAGVTPLSPSLDVVGPIARDVATLAELMDVLAPSAVAAPERSLRGRRVAVPEPYFLDDLEPGVAAAFDALLDVLVAAGARVRRVALRGVPDVADAMAALQNAEAARSLRAYWDDPRVSDGIRERIELGRTRTDAQLAAAERVADTWRATVAAAWIDADVLLTPGTPFTAPRAEATDLVALSRAINRTTYVWPLNGVPALVLPLAPGADDLPTSAQLIAPPGADRALLAVGAALQAVTDWHARTPPL
jgi:aspartyl-tRNA(Asn)/glutamyl-tRNA(Gln) amidotransferase subunit A